MRAGGPTPPARRRHRRGPGPGGGRAGGRQRWRGGWEERRERGLRAPPRTHLTGLDIFPGGSGPARGTSPSAEGKEGKKKQTVAWCGLGVARPLPGASGSPGPSASGRASGAASSPSQAPPPPAPRPAAGDARSSAWAARPPPPPVTAPPPPRSPPLADPPRKMVAFAPPRGCERGAVQPTPLAPPPPAAHWPRRAGGRAPLASSNHHGGQILPTLPAGRGGGSEDAPHAQAAVSGRAGGRAAGRFATASHRPPLPLPAPWPPRPAPPGPPRHRRYSAWIFPVAHGGAWGGASGGAGPADSPRRAWRGFGGKRRRSAAPPRSGPGGVEGPAAPVSAPLPTQCPPTRARAAPRPRGPAHAWGLQGPAAPLRGEPPAERRGRARPAACRACRGLGREVRAREGDPCLLRQPLCHGSVPPLRAGLQEGAAR